MASAVLQSADRVPETASYVPFSWQVEHTIAEPPNRRFVLHLVPERNCSGFLFRAPLGGQAQLLCEWEGKAEVDVRLPSTGEFGWDGQDDSLLVIVAAGRSSPADKTTETNLVTMSQRASPLRGGEPPLTATGPLVLSPEALGLKDGEPA